MILYLGHVAVIMYVLIQQIVFFTDSLQEKTKPSQCDPAVKLPAWTDAALHHLQDCCGYIFHTKQQTWCHRSAVLFISNTFSVKMLLIFHLGTHLHHEFLENALRFCLSSNAPDREKIQYACLHWPQPVSMHYKWTFVGKRYHSLSKTVNSIHFTNPN